MKEAPERQPIDMAATDGTAAGVVVALTTPSPGIRRRGSLQ